jgi:hypothetical protein
MAMSLEGKRHYAGHACDGKMKYFSQATQRESRGRVAAKLLITPDNIELLVP